MIVVSIPLVLCAIFGREIWRDFLAKAWENLDTETDREAQIAEFKTPWFDVAFFVALALAVIVSIIIVVSGDRSFGGHAKLDGGAVGITMALPFIPFAIQQLYLRYQWAMDKGELVIDPTDEPYRGPRHLLDD